MAVAAAQWLSHRHHHSLGQLRGLATLRTAPNPVAAEIPGQRNGPLHRRGRRRFRRRRWRFCAIRSRLKAGRHMTRGRWRRSSTPAWPTHAAGSRQGFTARAGYAGRLRKPYGNSDYFFRLRSRRSGTRDKLRLYPDNQRRWDWASVSAASRPPLGNFDQLDGFADGHAHPLTRRGGAQSHRCFKALVARS